MFSFTCIQFTLNATYICISNCIFLLDRGQPLLLHPLTAIAGLFFLSAGLADWPHMEFGIPRISQNHLINIKIYHSDNDNYDQYWLTDLTWDFPRFQEINFTKFGFNLKSKTNVHKINFCCLAAFSQPVSTENLVFFGDILCPPRIKYVPPQRHFPPVGNFLIGKTKKFSTKWVVG